MSPTMDHVILLDTGNMKNKMHRQSMLKAFKASGGDRH